MHAAFRVDSLRGHGSASELRADPSALWVLVGSISGLCLLSGHIASLFSGLVGLAYPTYLSVKALESHDQPTEGKGQDAKQELLIYWVCYALLLLAENLVGPWLSQVCTCNLTP